MEDTLEDLLQRLAGGSNSKTEASWEALSESGLQSMSELVLATETVGQRIMLQEELTCRAREMGVLLPTAFVEGLRMAVQESRLAYSGFPDAPPATATPILFTAPHALYLQRPGHKPHKPEAYTQHLARDFAQIVGGAFLTWTRREEARAKDYYKKHGKPDATNADPNFTLCCDLDVSPWTRNLKEVRWLFGVGRQCLHVDLHGCKDPGPEGGSDLVVGLGAMTRVNQSGSSFFRLAMQTALGACALNGFSVNFEPTKLTGVSPDGDRRTLTQQSVSEEGGAWPFAVQLELSRSLRLELSRKREMRFMVAKAILISFTLAYNWLWKPKNCVMYPLAEAQEWLVVCKAFHLKRRIALARSRAKALAKEGKEGKEEVAKEEPQDEEEGSLEPSADAEFEEDERSAKVAGAASEVEGTANNEPAGAVFPHDIEDWWPMSWIKGNGRVKDAGRDTDAGRGTAESLSEWLNKAGAACGHVHKPARPPTTEVQVLRNWLRASWQCERDEVVNMLIAKASGVPRQCYVTGTWNNWKPIPMDWDGYRFTYLVQIGENGWESFQIMVGQRWDHTVHPSVNDANPYMTYRIMGPDNKGHAMNWTIGTPPGKSLHPKNAAKSGDQYQIIVTLDEKEVPCRVTWKPWS